MRGSTGEQLRSLQVLVESPKVGEEWEERPLQPSCYRAGNETGKFGMGDRNENEKYLPVLACCGPVGPI